MRTYGECERCGIEDNSMRGPHLCQSCKNDDEIERLRGLLQRCVALLVRYENGTIRPEVGTDEAITLARAALAGSQGETRPEECNNPNHYDPADEIRREVKRRSRALAERVREACAQLAYKQSSGMPNVRDSVRALDLDALLEEP